MNDDYLRAASIVASCKNERLPYVLAYLSKAGLSTICPCGQKRNSATVTKSCVCW